MSVGIEDKSAEVLETSIAVVGSFSDCSAEMHGGLVASELYLGGGVSLVNARISSIDEKILLFRSWMLMESECFGLDLPCGLGVW